jgi:hypothetical protein
MMKNTTLFRWSLVDGLALAGTGGRLALLTRHS